MKWYGGKIGDIRIKKRYAIFPNKLDNGNWIWFDVYYAIQIYNEWVHIERPHSGSYIGWMTRNKFYTIEESNKYVNDYRMEI